MLGTDFIFQLVKRFSFFSQFLIIFLMIDTTVYTHHGNFKIGDKIIGKIIISPSMYSYRLLTDGKLQLSQKGS